MCLCPTLKAFMSYCQRVHAMVNILGFSVSKERSANILYLRADIPR